jgi:histidinol-phosphate aminotransferase
MAGKDRLSRRGFVGGVATALGYLTFKPPLDLFAQGRAGAAGQPRVRPTENDYDLLAKLANNENPYGPPESVMKAMTGAFKYANRYGYPDPGIVEEIAKHHGVKPDNVLLGSGSGEILDVASVAFTQGGKKVLAPDPTYDVVFSRINAMKADAIRVPLTSDFRQDTEAMVKAAKRHYRSIGYVYVCSPNNPTGRIVPRDEIKYLLDHVPDDLPVLIDEAYFHFVDDPQYATATPYVIDGRPVIVARTFSKIAALAGMRLGYAIAPRDLLQTMRPYSTGTINALVRYGGVAALKDTASQAEVKRVTLDLRKKTVADLQTFGYGVIPSEANFFMVHLKRPVAPVVEEFRKKGVLVGRPFPPLNEHLRVSVGTADEMSRFTVAFKQIMEPGKTANSGL